MHLRNFSIWSVDGAQDTLEKKKKKKKKTFKDGLSKRSMSCHFCFCELICLKIIKPYINMRLYETLIVFDQIELCKIKIGEIIWYLVCLYLGTAPPAPKSSQISIFCVLSQNCQHLFKK